jgi:hypothetical protein
MQDSCESFLKKLIHTFSQTLVFPARADNVRAWE